MLKFLVCCLRISGYVLLTIAWMVIMAGMIGIWITKGFAEVQYIFSPYNIVNDLAILLTISPGILLLALVERLESRAIKQDNILRQKQYESSE